MEEHYIRKIKESNKINKKNRQKIFDYTNEQKATNIKATTRSISLLALWRFAEYLEDTKFKDVEKRQIVSFLNDLKPIPRYRKDGSLISNRVELAHGTKELTKSRILTFYNWLYDSELPKEMKWLKKLFSQKLHRVRKHLTNGDLISNEEFDLIIRHARPRDKVIFSEIFEVGFRVGEVINQNIGDLEFDRFGCIAVVRGKTGTRKVRLVNSAPILRQYIENHPYKNEPNSPMWLKDKGAGRLRYNGIYTALQVLSKKTGIPMQKLHPHNWRHTALTRLARSGKIGEFALKEIAGWGMDSSQATRYLHGVDSNKQILKMHGKIDEIGRKIEDKFKPLVCVNCKTENPYNQMFCMECELPISKQGFKKYNTEKNELLNKVNNIVKENQKQTAELILTLFKKQAIGKPEIILSKT